MEILQHRIAKALQDHVFCKALLGGGTGKPFRKSCGFWKQCRLLFRVSIRESPLYRASILNKIAEDLSLQVAASDTEPI